MTILSYSAYVPGIKPMRTSLWIFPNGRIPLNILGKLALLLLFLVSYSGCGPLVKAEQPEYNTLVALNPGQSIGQTFVARYDGLEQISFYIQPGDLGEGKLQLQLRYDPQATDFMRITSIQLKEISTPGYYAFQFSPIEDSNLKYYSANLTFLGTGNIQVGTAIGNSYLNGALYLDQKPQDAQAAFLLGYQPGQATIGLLNEGLRWLLWLVVAMFLYVIPGWALFGWLYPGWSSLHWLERLGLAAGLSLAIYPLFFLWTDLVGLHLGFLYAWLPPLFGIIFLLYQNRRLIIQRIRPLSSAPSCPSSPASQRQGFTNLWLNLTLLVIISLIIATRFWAIRSLDVPMWGDSYHHTMITQLLVDHGGLFNSWQPYADLDTFTYHFGFHSLAAVFYWITRLPMPQIILWVGQIINILAVLCLFPLAKRISRNPWAGAVAFLVAGLLAPMPMYYVNWGRYTQLAGQVILPVFVCLTWAAQDVKESRRGLIFLSSLVLAGVALTHYRILVYAACFYAILILWDLRSGAIQTHLRKMLEAGMGAFLLFLPWLINSFAGRLDAIAAKRLSEIPALSPYSGELGFVVSDISSFLPTLLWLSLPLLAGWGLWRRDKGITLIGLWWFLIFAVTNPQLLSLPGAGLVSNFAVFIAAYIPASLLVGAASVWLIEWLLHPIQDTAHARLSRWQHGFLAPVLSILMVCLSLWGARLRLWDVNPSVYALVTRPDLRAAEWIKENTDPSNRFLINTLLISNDTIVVGTDGGWWLPILARRKVTVPPVTYILEQEVWPDLRTETSSFASEIKQKGVDHPEVLSSMIAKGIKYIYIGQQHGSVNSPTPFLDINRLLDNSHFLPIYHQDRVWIFLIKEPLSNE
jgi:hypothetical protein